MKTHKCYMASIPHIWDEPTDHIVDANKKVSEPNADVEASPPLTTPKIMNTQEEQLTQYRRLEMGEIVLATDEIYDDITREWVEPEWSVGKPAPDPDYTSHRQFRRKINSLPNADVDASPTLTTPKS